MIGKTKQQSRVRMAAAVPSGGHAPSRSRASRLVARLACRARLAVVICVACLGVLLLPAAASAALVIVPVPSFPTPVEVGETFVGSVSVFNDSRPPESAQFPTVRIRDLTLVPSCAPAAGAVGNDCPPPNSVRETGVFALAPTGTGVAEQGTPQGCVGTWTITETSPGMWSFTPPGGPGTLIEAPADVCRIDFAVTTLRVPTFDVVPGAPGVQTQQVATVTGVPRDGAGVDQEALAVTSSGEDITTVLQGQPGIETQVSDAAIDLGDSFTDEARLSFPAGAAVPTGTVTFRVYGPNDATCAGPPIFTSADRPLSGGAPGPLTAESAAFTPQTPGTYRVIATYNGGADPNYEDVSGACNDPNEQVVVVRATPSIATQAAPASVQLGQGTLTDTASVTGLVNPVTGAGAGTVTFTLYGPNDPNCTTPILTRSGRPLTLNGTATGGTASSGAGFNPPAAGTYSWVASYSGDANNAPVTGLCGEANEQTIVTAPPPPPPPQCVENGSVVQNNAGTVEQGGNTATGGSATASGGDGGDADSGNTVSSTGNVDSSGVITMGGDTETSSGDATGGDGGDANATGGNATATNTATQTQQNRCGGGGDDADADGAPDAAGAAAADAGAVRATAAADPGAAGAAAAADAGAAGASDAAGVAAAAAQMPAPLPSAGATKGSRFAQQVDAAATPPRGRAAISGRTRCQGAPFNVVVSGRHIARVTFALDGKVRRTLKRPNSASRYKLLVKPSTLRNGRHRVHARVSFRRQSATRARTLRVLFSRCATGAR